MLLAGLKWMAMNIRACVAAGWRWIERLRRAGVISGRLYVVWWSFAGLSLVLSSLTSTLVDKVRR